MEKHSGDSLGLHVESPMHYFKKSLMENLPDAQVDAVGIVKNSKGGVKNGPDFINDR